MKFESQIDKVKSFIGADKYKNTRVHTNIIRSSSNVAARASITFTNLMDLITSSTPPPNPTLNTCWIDISVTPAVFKRWDGSNWVIVNDWGGDIDDIKDNIKITEESLKTQSAEIKTMKDKIELKAEKTELNSKIVEVKDEALKYTDSKILEAKAGIKIETDRITQSVSETNKKVEVVEINTNNSFKAVNEKVTTNESSINTLKNQIQLKVEQKDLDRVTSSNNEYTNTKITEAKSEIKLTTDGINQEVSKKVNSNSIVSTINQSAEAIKLKAEKIELNGATSIGDTDKNFVKIENATYTIHANNSSKVRLGVSDYGAVKNVPSLRMGVYGIGVNNHEFAMVCYGGGEQNPSSDGRAYLDMGYYSRSDKDWSNIKIYDGGVIRIAPIKEFEITSNYVNGSYTGSGERRLALFTSTKSNYYDSTLHIEALRNLTNYNGLVLADDHASNKCAVRVNVDGGGLRFFRPLTNSADIDLGSSGFKWKKVYSNGGVGYSIVDLEEVRSIPYIDSSVDSVLDTLDFDMNIFRKRSEDSSDIQLNLNVSKLKEHPLNEMFLNVTEEYDDLEKKYTKHTTADMSSLLHLALYEIQKLKKEINELKNTHKV